MSQYIPLFQNGVLVFGSLIGAVILIMFFWSFVQYVFFGGDDLHRAHAKTSLIEASISLMFFMIVWAVVAFIGRALFG